MNFYEFNQNNSGGSFVVNDKLCHRVVIESENYDKAKEIAENMGIYFDGDGDCPCCGNRWSDWSDEPIDFEQFSEKGYPVSSYKSEADWLANYGHFDIVSYPKYVVMDWGSKRWEGSVRFTDIENYLKFMADEYGWTVPDVRIFYASGEVKEIFSKKKPR